MDLIQNLTLIVQGFSIILIGWTVRKMNKR